MKIAENLARRPSADQQFRLRTQVLGQPADCARNDSAHAPLLCVVNVFDVASGDLFSLPGKAE
ncbi:hypothetical protein [Noviherbaspirillum saxi]|uniref:Uncharacterized protein n=1 Tax=Noviherbaspirillum saxi TaxID=2320863 RepID=A0A3A3FT90_9BURK|nr:hypothetical protein [Noviherbaspirillum saxi]RJF99266.1 hypothetical protein D3871_12595 [Noviherbaspirillum saxi]